MKKNLLFLASITVIWVFVAHDRAHAQVKTITGTVTEIYLDNRMTGIVIRSGAKMYFVQTEFIVHAGDRRSDVTFRKPRMIGNVEKVGKRVRVTYTRIDKNFDWSDKTALVATRIVALN